MITRLPKEKAEQLATDIAEAITNQAYAVEVARLLKKHGLTTMKDLKDWIEKREAEEGER